MQRTNLGEIVRSNACAARLDVEQLVHYAKRSIFAMRAGADSLLRASDGPQNPKAVADRLQRATDVWIDFLRMSADELEKSARACEENARAEA